VCTLDLGIDLKPEYMMVPPETVTKTKEGAKSHVKLSHVENRPFLTRSEEFSLELGDSLSGDVSRTGSEEMDDACIYVGCSQSCPKIMTRVV